MAMRQQPPRPADSFTRIRDTVIAAVIIGIGTFVSVTLNSTLDGVNATLEKQDETQREVVLNQAKILVIQDYQAKQLDRHEAEIRELSHQRPPPQDAR